MHPKVFFPHSMIQYTVSLDVCFCTETAEVTKHQAVCSFLRTRSDGWGEAQDDGKQKSSPRSDLTHKRGKINPNSREQEEQPSSSSTKKLIFTPFIRIMTNPTILVLSGRDQRPGLTSMDRKANKTKLWSVDEPFSPEADVLKHLATMFTGGSYHHQSIKGWKLLDYGLQQIKKNNYLAS